MWHLKNILFTLVFTTLILGSPVSDASNIDQLEKQETISKSPSLESKQPAPNIKSKDATNSLEKENEVAALESERSKSVSEYWWLDNLVNILGIVAGALLIVWQLGRQHKNELRIQKENYREKLRLDIYQEFSKMRIEAESQLVGLGSYVSIIPTYFVLANETAKAGNVPIPIISRSNVFMAKHQEATNKAIQLIKLIEKYEIVSPEFEIFKIAMLAANYDLILAFTPLIQALVKLLPIEVPDKHGNIQTVNIITPTSEQFEEFEAIVNTYVNAKEDLCCYIFDFNLELQNKFLKGLFQNIVQFRKPKDPKYKVISTEPGRIKELMKYFEEETAWGKAGKRADEDVRRALENESHAAT